MKKPKYLSPTSIALFYRSPEEYYLKYLADQSPPRMPQTEAMAVGSSFDAHVKSYIYEKFYGKKDPAFELQTIFEQQVEPQNREVALAAGAYCFNCYKEYGSLSDLMLELNSASEAPRMEFTVEGRVTHEANVNGIPLSGKPDVYFKTKDGAHVVYDWKVNGYYGTGNTSPAKGYLKIRGHASFRGINQSHKDAMPMMLKGIIINTAHYLEQINDTWADQLAIYSWLLGVPVGEEVIVGIDQLVFSNPGRLCRVAVHRCRISPFYQRELYKKLEWAWKVIESGHMFRELSPEESLKRQQMLDCQYEAFVPSGDKNEDWYKSISRRIHGHRNSKTRSD
jgi:hypothetical protein